jgi:hypothetical protein
MAVCLTFGRTYAVTVAGIEKKMIVSSDLWPVTLLICCIILSDETKNGKARQ